MIKTVKKTMNKKRKVNGVVIIHVNASFNNTKITACEESGNVLAWASCGSVGFKNTKESTPFAAQTAAENLINKLKTMGAKDVKLVLKGPGAGRDPVIKTVGSVLNLLEMRDSTPIAYNGTRPVKRRRS